MEDMCYAGHLGGEERGLGLALLPAVATRTGVVKGTVGAVGKFFGKYDKDKDANRRATNARAYDLARAIHEVEAFKFLKGMSGKFGVINVAPLENITAGGPASGWASPPARADAYQKQAALAADGYSDSPSLARQAALAVRSEPVQMGAGMLTLLLLAGAAVTLGTKKPSYRRNPVRRGRRARRRS